MSSFILCGSMIGADCHVDTMLERQEHGHEWISILFPFRMIP